VQQVKENKALDYINQSNSGWFGKGGAEKKFSGTIGS
jgi:hypothetical protein